jgi:hypothetical protein
VESFVSAAAITDSEIIDRCNSGELLDDIGRQNSDIDDPNSLLNRCIALHNSGEIDLLSLTKTHVFNLLSGWGYFERQHFFCQAIPRLEAKPEPLMEAVERPLRPYTYKSARS